jgi:5-methylthioadenosine/S-adenosylhomocysteine deaminase
MLLTGLEVLTMVPGEAARSGSIRIRDGRIAAVGDLQAEAGESVHDCRGLTAVPGFVQGHVHLCQALFRNLAEDLPLLDWLRQRIWPLEAAHDAASLRASARLALFELVRGGCTTFQSMETVHGTEHVFAAVEASGLRAIVGNALMDLPAEGVPPGLVTTTATALVEAERLHAEWDGRAGRLHFALNPRFLLSCTPHLLRQVGRWRAERGWRVHTHAAEHPDEVRAVQAACGRPYVLALDDLGLLGPETSLAHCVHVDDDEVDVLARSGTAVLHCPSTNLKLGSGVARVAELVRRGIRVALGSDGAPANNRLDTLFELRQAALLSCWRAGPGALSAESLLALATRDGARALGLDGECGTLEPGKSADVVLLDLADPALGPGGDVATRIVYAAGREHVRHVLVAGRFAVRDGCVEGELGDAEGIAVEARQALRGVMERAALS